MEETLFALEAKLAAIKAQLAAVKNEYQDCQDKLIEKQKAKSTSCIVNSILSNPEQLPLKRPRTYKTKRKTDQVELARPVASSTKALKTVYIVNESAFDRLLHSCREQNFETVAPKSLIFPANECFGKSDAFSAVSYCVREVLHRKNELESTEVFEIFTSLAQVFVKDTRWSFFKALRTYVLSCAYQSTSLRSGQNLQQILLHIYIETAKKYQNYDAFKKLISKLMIGGKRDFAKACFEIWPYTDENSLVIMQLLCENRKIDKLILKFVAESNETNTNDHFLALKTAFLSQSPHASYKFYKNSICKAINKPHKVLPGRHLILKALGFLILVMETDDELSEFTYKIVKVLKKIKAEPKYTSEERKAAAYALSKLGNM